MITNYFDDELSTGKGKRSKFNYDWFMQRHHWFQISRIEKSAGIGHTTLSKHIKGIMPISDKTKAKLEAWVKLNFG